MDELELLRDFRADVEATDDLTRARAKAALRAGFATDTNDVALAHGPRIPRWTRAALAVLLGAGLGFGLATWLTPSGSATSSFAGFGFLPANGWTVVGAGRIDAAGAASALAANVPLDPADSLAAPPRATLESLPLDGVVVYARFGTRGDPAEDAGYPERPLPLRIADAVRGPTEYRLRAGVEGYNVDLRIYFGAAPPSPAALASAQEQLNRLIVAAERITLFARPTILGGHAGPAVQLFGSIDSGKAGEAVTIQAKDCGGTFFRVVGGAVTRAGGGWSTEHAPGITTTLRAVWNGSASEQAIIRQKAAVRLRSLLSSPELEVAVVARRPFWRSRVLIQRFDRRLGTWATVKPVVLTKQSARGASISTSGRFTTSLPQGTLIRALFPLAEARPCYLAGVSTQLRVP